MSGSPLSVEDQRLAQRLADGGLWPLLQRGWYEAGTFTPTFQGSGTAGTFTYVAQRGVYRRFGDTVHWMAQVAISAITVAPTGNMTIAGLPFTAGNGGVSGSSFAVTFGVISNVDYPAGRLEITGIVQSGQSVIQLFTTADNVATAAYPAASFTNANANILASGWYPL